MSKATDPKAPMRSPSPLQLSAEDMRRLGHQIIEAIIEHFQNLRDKPVTRLASRGHLEQRLREPIPEKGTEVEKLLEQLQRDVFANIMHLDHPRFFVYVPGPSNFVSVMADVLASGFNVFSGTWLEASGPTMIELITIDWLRQLFGLPETAGGLFCQRRIDRQCDRLSRRQRSQVARALGPGRGVLLRPNPFLGKAGSKTSRLQSPAASDPARRCSFQASIARPRACSRKRPRGGEDAFLHGGQRRHDQYRSRRSAHRACGILPKARSLAACRCRLWWGSHIVTRAAHGLQESGRRIR